MNKPEKSLRWVVNQIPDFKPTTNEEKMLVAIKLYSEAGAEEIRRLETENASLRERLERAVVNGKRFIVEKQIDGREVYVVCRYKVIKSYICTEYTREAAVARLAELKGGKE